MNPQLKETSRYDIIKHWIDNCNAEIQLINIREAIVNRFILDEKTKDDLIMYLDLVNKQRDITRAKAVLAYNQERKPSDDEFIDLETSFDQHI